jgi:hypothetical protein
MKKMFVLLAGVMLLAVAPQRRPRSQDSWASIPTIQNPARGKATRGLRAGRLSGEYSDFALPVFALNLSWQF